MRTKNLQYILLCIVLLFYSNTQAQDSLKKHFGIKNLQKFFVKKSISKPVPDFKSSINSKWKESFINFKSNEIYLFAGMNLSKQNIDEQSFNSAFNYRVEDINKNVFNPGYFVGARVDGKYNNKHLYSFALGLNKYVTGANYQNKKLIEPFIGTFTKFKADQQIFAMNLLAHYKFNFAMSNSKKLKYYIVAGPSVDFRLSSQSLDNQVNKMYKPVFLKADIGFEFDNQSYYTLFMHYKKGINSITKAPVNNYLNSFELGMLIKANDIF